MKRQIISGIVFMAFWSPCWAGGYDPCKTQANTIEINDCVKLEFEIADQELNQTYKDLIASLQSVNDYGADPKEVRAALVSAQRDWVQFRKKDCDGIYKLHVSGSIRNVKYFRCMKARTEKRIKELEQWDKP